MTTTQNTTAYTIGAQFTTEIIANGDTPITRTGVIKAAHPDIADFYRVEYLDAETLKMGRTGWVYSRDMTQVA